MRVYRSPKDNVIEIDVQSFGLKSLFVLMTIVACILGFVLLCQRAPLRDATVVQAFCLNSDWNSYVANLPHSDRDDYKVYGFRLHEAKELFTTFATKPALWAKVNVLDLIPKQQGELRASGTGRYRPIDRPVDGFESYSRGPNMVADHIVVGGKFEKSNYSQRCYLDFSVSLETATPTGRQKLMTSSRQLEYHGSASDELIVFAIPLDNDLVHLVIVDLNKNNSTSFASSSERKQP